MVVMFAHINFVFIFAASNYGEVARLNELIRAGSVGYLPAPKRYVRAGSVGFNSDFPDSLFYGEVAQLVRASDS